MMMFQKLSRCFFCLILLVFFYNLADGADSNSLQLTLKSASPNGTILLTNFMQNRLYAYHTALKKVEPLDQNLCAAQVINKSHNGKLVAYKQFQPQSDGSLLQVPVVYQAETNKIIPLSEPVARAGVPCFTKNGHVAVTIDKDLLILNTDFKEINRFQLPNYVNLAPISPNGEWVVYNDLADQLWLLETGTGNRTKLTADRKGYFAPVWSPDNQHLAASTLDGSLVIWDIRSQTEIEIGPAESPIWSPAGDWLFYRHLERNSQLEVVSSDLAAIKADGKQKTFLTQTSSQLETAPQLSPDGKTLYFSIEGDSVFHQSEIQFLKKSPVIHLKKSFPLPKIVEEAPETGFQIQHQDSPVAEPAVYFDAPYIHQVYDVPDWFKAGHSACGATAAMMALTYYKVLPAWPCTASRPSPHTSNFGRYISDIYTFNNFTYNILGSNSKGETGYGGFGFIVQNNWADTKGYMAKYICQHGLGSAADFDPNFSKVMVEVDHQFPFVLLNSLTSAGHYILIIGYIEAYRSLIANDPYGNRNYPSYPNTLGKKVTYDWPGYHNGNANLNIVHCFIYARKAADLAVAPFSAPDTVALGDTIHVQTQIYNNGLAAADSFSYGFYWLKRAAYEPDVPPFASGKVSSMAPADSLTISSVLVVPDSMPSRKYGLAIFCDSYYSIIEMEENNNLLYSLVVVRGYPTLSIIRPSPNGHTASTQPQLLLKHEDNVCGIDPQSIRVWLDEKEITALCTINAFAITYTPDAALAYGLHTIKAEVTNFSDYTTRVQEQFTIDQPTGIAANNPVGMIKITQLLPNFPNPFNLNTRISYQVASEGRISIQIYDVSGRLIRTLKDDYQRPGAYSIQWDGRAADGGELASGIYFCRLQLDAVKQVRSLVLLK